MTENLNIFKVCAQAGHECKEKQVQPPQRREEAQVQGPKHIVNMQWRKESNLLRTWIN